MSFHESYSNTPDGSFVSFELSDVDPNGDLYGVVGNILQFNITPDGDYITFTAGEKDFDMSLDRGNVDALIEWLQKHKDKVCGS